MIGANLPTFPVFPGVSKPHQTRSPGESIKSTAPGKHLPWPFPKFFHYFVILEMSKRKIKQEVDLVLLFELILIRKRKTEQSNWYIFNEYRNWSKSTNQIAQCMVESWRGFRTLLSTSGTFGRPSCDFRRVFGHCPNWHSYNTKISRHLQIFVLRKLVGRLVEKYNRRKLVWRGCYKNICQ